MGTIVITASQFAGSLAHNPKDQAEAISVFFNLDVYYMYSVSSCAVETGDSDTKLNTII